MSIHALEQCAIKKILSGELPELRILREQLVVAKVVIREMTGVGFWTEFMVPDSSQRLEHRGLLQISGVHARHPLLQAGIGFQLEVMNGTLRSLEGYTFEEPWPANLDSVTIEEDTSSDDRLRRLGALFAMSR